LFYIGTDIIKIDRLAKLSEDITFLNKIFTQNEINYCSKYSDVVTHLSGKYAGKEAVKKALLSSNIVKRVSLKDIEILNRSDKSPYVILNLPNDINCKISISHDGDYALAFSLLVL
jgi:holo-[acyl-carrier protein] synthase